MTPDAFAAAVANTRLGARAIEAARLVLIDGLSAAEAGRRVGRTREMARAAAARVARAHRERIGCPPGWITVTVCIPRAAQADLLDAVARITAGR